MTLDPRPLLIVFDWDGTLTDSAGRIVGTFRKAMTTIGALAPEDDTTIRETIGLELPEAARLLLPHAAPSVHAALVEAYRDHWLAPDAPRPELFDDTLECLEGLRSRGLWLAVATGKSRRGLDREMGQLGLSDMFVATRCADETAGKPHPRMLRELMAERAVAPEQTVMVGDTTFDLDMANNAGVRAVAVTTGAHGAERLRSRQPVACVERVGRVVGLMG